MKFSVPAGINKTLKITGITLISLVAILFILPYLFPDAISNKIKDAAKSRLKGEINFSSASFSFFSHFPIPTYPSLTQFIKQSQ